jgi:hypothetical protein
MQRVRNKSKAKRTEKSKHETLARPPFRYILLQQKQNQHKVGTRNLHSFDLQHPQAKHISQAKAPNQSDISIIYSPKFCPPPLSISFLNLPSLLSLHPLKPHPKQPKQAVSPLPSPPSILTP